MAKKPTAKKPSNQKVAGKMPMKPKTNGKGKSC